MTVAFLVLFGLLSFAKAAPIATQVMHGSGVPRAARLPPGQERIPDDGTGQVAAVPPETQMAINATVIGQQGQNAAALAAKDGQPPMGGPWGVRYATIIDPSLPRVLLIGDSIANGYGTKVAERLRGKANVDVWITPNWLSPELSKEANDVLKQTQYSVIHFNESGLHAWDPGRIPDGQYGPLMRKYLTVLESANPKARLIWASTTPVTAAGKPGELDPLDKLISERNAICIPIMQKNGTPVDDLHSLMMGHLDLARGDRFHWVDKGYDLMTDSIVGLILRQLNSSAASPKD